MKELSANNMIKKKKYQKMVFLLQKFYFGAN